MYIINSIVISVMIFLTLYLKLENNFFPPVSIFFLSLVCSNIEFIFENRFVKFFSYLFLIAISTIEPIFLNISILVLFSYILKNGFDFKFRKSKIENINRLIVFLMLIISIHLNFCYGFELGIRMLCIFILSTSLALSSSNYKISVGQVYEAVDEKELFKIKMKNEIRKLNLEKEILIQNEILNERNKIAKQIHDNVGHRVSSAIFKIGALLAINESKETQPIIENLESDLNLAMNDIKKSVYSIYDELGELKEYLEKLIDKFDFCEVNFSMNFNDIKSKNLKFTIISIVKEALSNIIKHSDASLVNINITLSSGSVKILIVDNGTKYIKKSTLNGDFVNSGLGLHGMEENVKSLKGRFNSGFNNGFRIFITIPIEGK